MTIILWDYALNWLGYRFSRIQQLVRPRTLLLIKDGELLYRNLRKELITKDELISLIREQGIEDLHQVKEAYLEGDGQISVIPRRPNPRAREKARHGKERVKYDRYSKNGTEERT